MEKTKLNFGEAISFIWHDSKALEGWQYDPTRKRNVGTIHTLGRVVQSSDEGITVTSSLCGLASIDDLTVPWGAVEILERLPEKYFL